MHESESILSARLDTFLSRLHTPSGMAWGDRLAEILCAKDGVSTPNRLGLRLGIQGAGGALSREAEIAAADFVRAASEDLARTRSEVLRQARQSYVLVVTTAMLAVLLAVAASALYAVHIAAGGVAASIGTAIGAATAGTLFRVYRIETARADAVLRDLQTLEELRLTFVLTGAAIGLDKRPATRIAPLPDRSSLRPKVEE